ncbi:MAG: hypothetical protein HOH43_06660 [Candidatus Latescibacteria bacterium]|jgi:hypothetical protein|nr:hypothetical protein [Candidatus Latescibacterota bacterium]
MNKPSLFHRYTLTSEDRVQMDEDGHLALPGLLTEEATGLLTSSLSRVQELSEADVEHKHPPNQYAAEFDPYLASLIGHPQMLTLARDVLGSDIRYDHCVSLSRRGGNAGSNWHSHSYGESNPSLGFVRIFFYVNGFQIDDANLKVVPGSHLYRDPGLRADSDEELSKGWMQGKPHPKTGKPLEIVPLEVPEGTVILMWTHAAHGVTPRQEESDTRWCVVYAYRNPGEPSGARWITESFETSQLHGTEGLMPLY